MEGQVNNSVLFKEIETEYLVNTNVCVQYSISGDLEVNSRDWIGLFKKGWKSHGEYVYYEWSPYPAGYVVGTEITNSVVFPGSKLPKDDKESYQFCYVSRDGLVKGKSALFSFRKYSPDELYEVDDEDPEVLVVNTRKSLESQLEVANKEIKQLKQDNKRAEERISSLFRCCLKMQDDLDARDLKECQLTTELDEVKDNYKRETGNSRLMKITLKSYENNLFNHRKELTELKNKLFDETRKRELAEMEVAKEKNSFTISKEKFKKQIASLETENSSLAGRIEKLSSENTKLKEDCEEAVERVNYWFGEYKKFLNAGGKLRKQLSDVIIYKDNQIMPVESLFRAYPNLFSGI